MASVCITKVGLQDDQGMPAVHTGQVRLHRV